MAQRVFFHIGLPKTGTTYLQTLMWNNRDELRRQGVLVPGESNRVHLWASGVVREDPNLDRRGPEAKHAWDRLVAETPETVLDLLELPGVGPKTAAMLHQKFKIASLSDLRKFVDGGGLETVDGIGPKTAERIKSSLDRKRL